MLFADCVSLSYHRICPLPLFIFVNNNNNNTHVSNFLRRNIINNDPVICQTLFPSGGRCSLPRFPRDVVRGSLSWVDTLLQPLKMPLEFCSTRKLIMFFWLRVHTLKFLNLIWRFHQSENRIRPRSDSLYIIIIITPNVNEIIPLDPSHPIARPAGGEDKRPIRQLRAVPKASVAGPNVWWLILISGPIINY